MKKANAKKYPKKDISKLDKHDAKRAKIRGATREANDEDKPPFKWGRAGLIMISLAALVWGGVSLPWQSIYSRAYEATNRPLANVKIESEFRFVSQQILQEVIAPLLTGSFVDLDLRVVKKTLERDPWIEEVSIERIWPDSLKLKINEHKPIARWNNNGYVSHDGKLIEVPSNDVLKHLPLLSGTQEQGDELAHNYGVFTQMLKKSQLRITAISVDKKNSWQVNVDEQFLLILGRERIQERLENFQYVYEAHLKTRKEKIERIDMRYEQGLAVQWSEPALVATRAAQ